MKCTAAFSALAGLFFFLFSPALRAQTGRPDISFGSVTAADFSPALTTDSAPRAIILFDRGEVAFDNTRSNRGYGVIFQRHTRILLLHKSAFGLASFTLSTYRKDDASLEDFKGATYNLENGSVTASRLDKSNIFKDKNSHFDLEKIAFPNIKEGSIIEYSYTIVYPNIGFVPPWSFQGSYPELWSEYDITVPRLFDYAVKKQGYQQFALDTVISYDGNTPGLSYGVTERSFLANQSIRHIWAQQNVPVLEKLEPYTTTLKNHISRIEFQLSAIRRNGFTETYSTTWPQLTHELLKSDNFGAQLTEHNRWMDDDLKKITSGATSTDTMIRRIYSYVRDNFVCLSQERTHLSQPIKKTWEEKKGTTIADINLLLTALYRHQGLDASPVILSSRANGYAHDGYPLISEYNYVITRVRTPGGDYLLDASKPWLGFGQLPELCYNGWARVIDSTHDRIPLLPDSAKENRLTVVTGINTDSGYTVTFSRTVGPFESMNMRNQLKRAGPDEFFEGIKKSLATYKQFLGGGIDSATIPEAPLTWHYEMKWRLTAKRLYVNPALHERFVNNPFSAEDRHYPVEMPYLLDNVYHMQLEIPKGYEVEQLPKSQRIRMDDSSGFFEYHIAVEGNTISFQQVLRLNKAVYPLEEYTALRKFFSLIADKEKEPIILKKL